MKIFKKIGVVVMAAVLCLGVFALSACNGGDKEGTLVGEIALTEATLKLEKGTEKSLNAIVDLAATDRNVTWYSSNPAVATVVKDGEFDSKVKGIAVGSAVVSVTAADGSGITAYCNVTVTEPLPPAALQLTSANGFIAFYNDGTYFVKDKFMGSVDFEYSSTYSITAKSLVLANPGPAATTTFGDFPTYPTAEIVGDTVVIKVNSNNGSDIILSQYTMTKAQAEAFGLEVGEYIPVTGMTLKNDTITIIKNQDFKFDTIVEFAPANATIKGYTIALKADQPNDVLRFLSSGKEVKGLKDGKAVVVVKATDGSFTQDCEITVVTPAKPDEAVEFFDADITFKTEMDFGILIVYQSYAFDTQGNVIITSNSIMHSVPDVSNGYYTLGVDSIKIWTYLDIETPAEYVLNESVTDDALYFADAGGYVFVEGGKPISATAIAAKNLTLSFLQNATVDLANNVTFTPAYATDKRIAVALKAGEEKGIIEINGSTVKGVKAGTVTVSIISLDGGHTVDCELTILPLPEMLDEINNFFSAQKTFYWSTETPWNMSFTFVFGADGIVEQTADLGILGTTVAYGYYTLTGSAEEGYTEVSLYMFSDTGLADPTTFTLNISNGKLSFDADEHNADSGPTYVVEQ